MDARPASWSPPADSSRAAVAAVAAAAVFAAAWAGIHYGFYADNHIVDTPVYQRYGDAIADGGVPYRDFTVEYPPGALPAFAVPSLVVVAVATGVAIIAAVAFGPADAALLQGGDGAAET